MKKLSVIICCYNSENRLPETLKHIAKQNIKEGIKWEVVIIDNNSSDNTSNTAKSEWDKHKTNIPLRIITEPKQGLIFAREKGVNEATYDILIFSDDDNWLDLVPLLREQAWIAIPMKPLCRSSCEGLCPQSCTAYRSKDQDRIFRYWFHEMHF